MMAVRELHENGGSAVAVEEGTPVVVVGVDGSAHSSDALQWAARYASLVGGELHAIIAWEQGPGFGFFPEGARGFEEEARHTIKHTVDKALGTEHTNVVTIRVIQGNPTSVLVTESEHAHLLVVGDRGYGGFAGRLIGSVAESCARRAKCSVVIVRGEQ